MIDKSEPDTRRRGRLVISAVDQAASSASNFLLILLVAGALSAASFGFFSIGYAVLTFGLSVGRAALGAIIGIDLPRASQADARDLVRRSTGAALVIGFVLSGLEILLSVFAGEGAAGALLVLALSAPILMVQDLWRYWAVAAARPIDALVSDVSWLTMMGACLAWRLSPIPSPDSPTFWTLPWLGGILLGTAVLVARHRWVWPHFRLRRWLVHDRRRLHLAADAVLASMPPVLVATLVALFAGAVATGSIRGAGTLFGPLNVLFASIALAAVPEVARTSVRDGNRQMVWLTVVLLLVTGVWGLVLSLLPAELGQQLLGDTWGGSQAIIHVTAIEYVGLALWACGLTLLRARSNTGLALRLRFGYALTVVLTAVILTAIFRSALASATAMAASALALGIFGLILGIRRQPSTTGTGNSLEGHLGVSHDLRSDASD